ncbi:MAG: hypothetical protein ABEJ26_07945 [Halosimplex sp.]
MKCANCQAEGSPAYTLRAHIDTDGDAAGEGGTNEAARTDGGGETVDLPFCSMECLTAWT